MGERIHPGGLRANTDLQLSRDKAGLWTGSQVYHIRREDFPSIVPATGSPHPKFPILGVESVEVVGMPQGLMRMTIRYEGATVGDDEEEDEDQEPEYSLDLSVSDEPLATHPRYKDLSADEISEAVELATNPPKDDEGKAVEEVDTSEWPDRQIELYDFIRKGFESYREPRVTWTKRWVSGTRPADLNAIGEIDQPDGGVPQAAAGRNWLLVGLRSTQRGRVFENEQVWELSGRGGWNEEIYGE